MKKWIKIIQAINVIPYICRLEKADHLAISIDTEKTFEKSKLICDRNSENKNNFFNRIKVQNKSLWQILVLLMVKLTSIPFKIRNKLMMTNIIILFNIILISKI